MKAFIDAVKAGRTEYVQEMLADDPILADATDESGVSAVLIAQYYGRQLIRDMILDLKSELDVFEACAVGRYERVKELIAQQPGLVKDYSVDGFAAIGLASFFGHDRIVKMLLDSGASPNMMSRNSFRAMPLHSALSNKYTRIAELLIREGADVNSPASGGWTPLHYVAHNGDIETARLLLYEGADPFVQRDDGRTPAEVADLQGFRELAQILGG